MATIAVDLVARTAAFQRNMNRAAADIGHLRGAATRAATAIKGMAAAVGAYAAWHAAKAAIRSTYGEIDRLAKTADKLGMTTQSLAGLRHAAEQTGVAANTMDMAIQRSTRRIAEAARGAGEAKDAIAELGLDAQKLAKMSPDQQFAAIADAMKNVQSQSDQVRLAFKLFDSEGVAVVNTLRGGSEMLQQYAKDAADLGIAISRVEAGKIEQANDAMDRAAKAARGLAIQAAIKLAPALKTVADYIVGTVKYLRDMSAESAKTAISWIKWTAAIGAVVFMAPRVIGAVTGIVQAIRQIRNAMIVAKAIAGGPKAWASIIAGAALAAGAIYAVDRAMAGVNTELAKIKANAEESASGLAKATASANDLAGALDQVGDSAKTTQPILLDGIAAAANDATDAAYRLGEQLRQTVETWGMSSDQADLYRLKKQGASRAAIEFAQSMMAEKAAMEAGDEARKRQEKFFADQRKQKVERAEAMARERQQVIDSLKGPTEQLQDRIAHLKRIGLDPSTFTAAAGRAISEARSSIMSGVQRIAPPSLQQVSRAEYMLAGKQQKDEMPQIAKQQLTELREIRRNLQPYMQEGLSG